MSYYKEQLNRIKYNEQYPPSIVIYDAAGNKTNFMDLHEKLLMELVPWFYSLHKQQEE